MLVKTNGIIIKNTNFKDNGVITKIFTSQFGIQSFVLNGVRNQKGAIKPSHIFPLNLVEMVIYRKENANIQHIKELRCHPPLNSLHFNVLKNGIALFISEILNASLTEEEPNEELFLFLQNFIIVLDLESEKLANYPLYFLMHLCRYLGFYPKGIYKEGQLLNLKEGLFVDSGYQNTECIDAKSTLMWRKMMEISLHEWSQTHLSKQTRTTLLDQLLLYYQYHGLHGKAIKSHKVLHEVFAV
ncbi:MAG: DNA repair protein RecO [Flavobacteriales bacterium]|nr:DNA repair protein RecO [Flavobacteriales bacterium]